MDANVYYMARRRAEDIAACQTLGANAIHLPFLEAPHRGYASAATSAQLLEPQKTDLILSSLCFGNHVDHHVVLDAMRQSCAAHTVLLWKDWPYAERKDRVAAMPAVTEQLTPETRARRISACAAYESQRGFQFGRREAMTERTGRIAEERFYSLHAH